MAHKEAFSTAAKNVRSNLSSCFLVQLVCKFGSLIKLVNHGYWLKKGAFLKLLSWKYLSFSVGQFSPNSVQRRWSRELYPDRSTCGSWFPSGPSWCWGKSITIWKNSATSSFKTKGSLIIETNHFSWLKLVIRRRFFGRTLHCIYSIACPFPSYHRTVEVGSIHSIAKTYPHVMVANLCDIETLNRLLEIFVHSQ